VDKTGSFTTTGRNRLPIRQVTANGSATFSSFSGSKGDVMALRSKASGEEMWMPKSTYMVHMRFGEIMAFFMVMIWGTI
jgi:hypothetical protein